MALSNVIATLITRGADGESTGAAVGAGIATDLSKVTEVTCLIL